MHSPQHKLTYYVILLCLTSCTAFRPIISKKSELTEADLKAKIIPGKKYLFELKSGQTQEVKVTAVDSVNFHGDLRLIGKGNQDWVPFIESYSRLYSNVAKVKVHEKSPGRTVITVILIAGAVTGLGFLVSSSVAASITF